MLTRSPSSWTATLRVTQSRGRAQRDWWLRLVTTLKSGSTPQILTAFSVGEAEFYAVVKGGQVGLSLRSMYQDLGIPMKIEIPSDSSTANSLTDRLGAGQRSKHIDTRYFSIQERVQDGPQCQESAHCEELCRCWNEASICFSTTTALQVCRTGILLTMDPTLHCKMKVMNPIMDLVKGLSPRYRQRPKVNTEPRRDKSTRRRRTNTETDSWQR